ncbi:capsid protein [Dipodfec virus UA06Rod_119]|uniref:Capsid protein n=1 Tax=Dipodfec virus UA06Rod_119 TaxID=2929248 RepID=A0A976N1I7_9VIRU|nr:capsid protein [Dipodfec virus UA06Rod_119]
MIYRRRKYGRTYRRRPSFRRKLYRRTKRRYRRSRRTSTKSSVVCLTYETSWQPQYSVDTTQHWPFSFSPYEISAFREYKTVYSHYRILKAKMYMAIQYPGSEFQGVTNYLVVGSRPFASVARPVETYPSPDWVPLAKESELRQARWQRLHYPNTTTQVVTVGFYPYTMVGTLGPTDPAKNGFFQRIWEGKKWTPFSWAWNPDSGENSNSMGVQYYGPYVVRNYANTNKLPPLVGINVQLKFWCQFKGQR